MAFEKEGFVQAPVAGMLAIALGIGIAVLCFIVLAAIAGSTQRIAMPDLVDTNTSGSFIFNTTIRGSINTGVEKGFSGLETVGKYLPLVVIGLMAVLVIGALMMFGGTRSGTAI